MGIFLEASSFRVTLMVITSPVGVCLGVDPIEDILVGVADGGAVVLRER